MAAAQDDADAGKRASALQRTLAPATVEEVKERIAKWTAAPAIQQANVVAVSDQAWQSAAEAPATLGGSSEHQSTAPAAEKENPIQRAQELLMKHGFNIGEPDGKMGSRTANAIRLFELQSGMR
jgi:localization factor PodJL